MIYYLLTEFYGAASHPSRCVEQVERLGSECRHHWYIGYADSSQGLRPNLSLLKRHSSSAHQYPILPTTQYCLQLHPLHPSRTTVSYTEIFESTSSPQQSDRFKILYHGWIYCHVQILWYRPLFNHQSDQSAQKPFCDFKWIGVLQPAIILNVGAIPITLIHYLLVGILSGRLILFNILFGRLNREPCLIYIMICIASDYLFRHSTDDQENTRQFLLNLSDNNHRYKFRPLSDASSDDFLYVHQSQDQKRLMQIYGNEICLLDATYQTSKYALPLFFVVVPTNISYQVVGTFMLSKETSGAIGEALTELSNWNPEWKPSFWMTDYDTAERNAVENLFPG